MRCCGSTRWVDGMLRAPALPRRGARCSRRPSGSGRRRGPTTGSRRSRTTRASATCRSCARSFAATAQLVRRRSRAACAGADEAVLQALAAGQPRRTRSASASSSSCAPPARAPAEMLALLRDAPRQRRRTRAARRRRRAGEDHPPATGEAARVHEHPVTPTSSTRARAARPRGVAHARWSARAPAAAGASWRAASPTTTAA